MESGGYKPQEHQPDQEGALGNDTRSRPGRDFRHGGFGSQHWWRSWRRLLCLWAVLVLVGGRLTAPGVWCQSDGSFTFHPGDEGYVCSTFCRTSIYDKCIYNSGCAVIDSALQIIVNDGTGSNLHMSARFMRQQPVRLWNTSFWTFFVVRVSEIPGVMKGDGLTFLIAANATVPEYSEGQNLGLFLNGTDGTGYSRVAAVVFDTYQNPEDPDIPYVGMFVNTMKASDRRAYVPFSTFLDVDFFGNTFGVWVEYNPTDKQLQMSMLEVNTPFSDNPARQLRHNAVLLFSGGIDIKPEVAEVSYLGFSAAGGSTTEVNEILYWQFQIGESTALPALEVSPVPAVDPALVGHGAPAPVGDGAPGMLVAAVVAGTCTVVLVVLILSGALLCCCWRKRLGPWAGLGAKGRGGAKGRRKINLTTLGANSSARKFSYDELRKATQNFAETSVLGQGGFGKVFRGELKDGTVVAVKRISEQSRQGEKEFLAEVTIIQRLRHQSLVPLLGWCLNNSKGELLLVYEYMPNGSLDHHVLRQDLPASSNSASASPTLGASTSTSSLQLTGTSGSTAASSDQMSAVMSWDIRYHVLQGVASALLYLHEDWQEGGGSLRQAVVHRDIKSSNVMLDADWNGRLGDFGMARVVEKNRPSQTASNIVGTQGYLAPEYARFGKVSVLTDVYSFGVLVLEVVTGRRPFDWRQPDHKRVLIDWIRSLHQANDRLESAADPALGGAFNTEQVVLLLRLGLMCTADDPEDRPSMRYVVQSLPISTNLLPLSSTKLPEILSPSTHGGSNSDSGSTSTTHTERSERSSLPLLQVPVPETSGPSAARSVSKAKAESSTSLTSISYTY